MILKIENKIIKESYEREYMTPLSLTIHNTNTIVTSNGRTMAQQYADAQNNGNMKGCYVHFYVDKDSIVQVLPIDRKGVHAGDTIGNNTSIAIEGIGADSLENVINLVHYLLESNPKLEIKTHKQWSGKECPIYFLKDWNTILTKMLNYKAPINAPNANDTPYKDAVAWVQAECISDGTRPNDAMTRGELFEILRRMCIQKRL